MERESLQRATALLSALDLSPGDWAADVGAGDGYYTMRLAEIVGRNGKVFAEDISDSAIERLNSRVRASELANAEVIKGESNDPKLPTGQLSAVLVVDTCHHFADYPAMLEKIFEALKPGGRLAIADYSFGEHQSLPCADQLKLHEIAPELVRAEITKAGFVITKSEARFVQWAPGVGNARVSATDMWLIIARRPR